MLRKIRSIEFVNFCQHERKSFEFPSGAVGLVGPNGCGKSNLLLGIYSGLVGDFSRIHPRREDCVRQQAGDDEPAYISVEVDYVGGSFNVRRDLRTGRSRLIASDGTELRATRDVNQQIQNYLGLSPAMLADYAFVEQGKLCDFLSYTPAARANAFSTLCRTDFSETLWKLLGETLSEDRSLVHDFDNEQLRSFKADLQRLDRQRRTYRRRIREAKLNSDDKAKIKKAEKIVNNYSAAEKAAKYADNLKSSIERYRSVVGDLEESIAEKQEDVDTTQASVDASKEEASNARYLLRGAELNLKKIEKRRIRQRELETVKKQRKELKQPTYEEFDIATGTVLDDVKQEVVECSMKIDELVETILTLEDHDGSCPTCQQPIPNKEEWLEHRRQEVSELKERRAAAAHLIDQFRQYEARYKVYEKKARDLKETIASLTAGLEQLDDVEDISREDIEGWKVSVADFNALTETLAEEKDELSKLQQKLEVQRARIAQFEEQLAETLDSIEDEGVTKEDYTNARRYLREIRDRRDMLTSSRTALKLCKEEYDKTEERLTRARNRKKELARASKWVKDIELVRDVFHRDNLPRAAAQQYLSALEDEINRNLSSFDTPFKVTSCDNLQLKCQFPDGRQHYGDKLSGGLQIVLAVAFRFAVYSIFAPELGTMVLDEPTVFLDYDNVDYLREAIAGMNAKMREQDRQVLVVTHESRLMRAFDTVFSL